MLNLPITCTLPKITWSVFPLIQEQISDALFEPSVVVQFRDSANQSLVHDNWEKKRPVQCCLTCQHLISQSDCLLFFRWKRNQFWVLQDIKGAHLGPIILSSVWKRSVFHFLCEGNVQCFIANTPCLVEQSWKTEAPLSDCYIWSFSTCQLFTESDHSKQYNMRAAESASLGMFSIQCTSARVHSVVIT
jgi:hypothetical protein